MAQEESFKEVANSQLRMLPAYNKSSKCTNVQIGEAVLLYNAMNRRIKPRWRGPAKISDIAETGVTVKFQSLTFKAARYSVRKKSERRDSEDVEMDPLQTQMSTTEAVPWECGKRQGNEAYGSGSFSTLRNERDEMGVGEEKRDTTSTTGISGDGSHTPPGSTPGARFTVAGARFTAPMEASPEASTAQVPS